MAVTAAGSGMEVADVMMLEEKEVIFFTQGGDYVAPRLTEEVGPDGASSGLPGIVGAYKVRCLDFSRI